METWKCGYVGTLLEIVRNEHYLDAARVFFYNLEFLNGSISVLLFCRRQGTNTDGGGSTSAQTRSVRTKRDDIT